MSKHRAKESLHDPSMIVWIAESLLDDHPEEFLTPQRIYASSHRPGVFLLEELKLVPLG